MRILLAIPVYDYGIRELGYSTEYNSLYLCLKSMGLEIILFDYLSRFQEVGRETMNDEFHQLVLQQNPDVTLVSLYTDQFIPETLDQDKSHKISIYYAYDDMWRTTFVDYWAPHFTHVTTSYIKGVENMRARGHPNGIYLSFACNHYAYIKKDSPKRYDVSFVGMKHPHRQWLVHWLEKSGLKVHVWGRGWGDPIWKRHSKVGRVPLETLVDIINQSRINLNLSNETSWDVRYLLSSPWATWNTLRSKKHFAPVNLRVFEINCCGGFQIVPYMEGLEKRYDIGNELVVFQNPEQLVERVHYYLAHADEREAIGQRGYERTLGEHTMEQRFRYLFEYIGLSPQ